MQDSDSKSRIVGLLSNTYTSLIENAKEHQSQLEGGSASVHSNGLEDHAKDILSAMEENNSEGDKAKQVVSLLEHYSSALVKLVESKLNDK